MSEFCSVCHAEPVYAKTRGVVCYRYWLRHGRRKDRDPLAVADRNHAARVRAEELRVLVAEARRR